MGVPHRRFWAVDSDVSESHPVFCQISMPHKNLSWFKYFVYKLCIIMCIDNGPD